VKLIEIDADHGNCKIDSASRQCPDGEDFPDSDEFLGAFYPWGSEFSESQIKVEGEDIRSGPYALTDEFRHGFFVSKGKKPRIYLGVHILLQAQDGLVSLMSGKYNTALHKRSDGGSGLSYTYIRL